MSLQSARNINDALPKILQLKPQVTVAEVSGRIVLGRETARLRSFLDGLVRQGSRHILLDLSQVSYLDSGGLGELVAALGRLQAQGAQLKICGLTERIENLLVIAKLVTVFECHRTRGEAMASFALGSRENGKRGTENGREGFPASGSAPSCPH